jgi:hypothetical protein
MKLKLNKLPINFRYYFLGLLLIVTATATTNFFRLGMAGLIVFVIAYLSKGMRKVPPPQ